MLLLLMLLRRQFAIAGNVGATSKYCPREEGKWCDSGGGCSGGSGDKVGVMVAAVAIVMT